MQRSERFCWPFLYGQVACNEETFDMREASGMLENFCSIDPNKSSLGAGEAEDTACLR